MTTTAAIYTRISADRTGEQLGVQRQYDACLELSNRLGWNVVQHFDDNDISAYNGKRRPGFEALLAAMEHSEIDAVVVWHIDRLQRSLKDLARLMSAADAGRVQLRTVNSGDIDLSTAAGQFMATVLGGAAVQESAHASERRKLANAQARAAGKWRNSGAAVFGYDRKGQVVEHEGALIRKAAKDLLAGRSLRGLAREWNDAGVLTRRGGKWSAVGFRMMIANARYAALMTHQGKVVGKGEWEAILDEETHLAIAAMLADPSRLSHHSFERVYQGSGVYLCGECGGKLRPVSSKPTVRKAQNGQSGQNASDSQNGQSAQNAPTTRSYGCPGCFKVSCKVELLDEFVSGEILGMLLVNDVGGAIDDDSDSVAELTRRHEGLQARLNELTRLFAAGEIDGQQLSAGSTELHAQQAGIASLLASMLRTSPAANLLNGDGDLRERWDATSPEMRGRIIDELVTVTVRRVGQSRGRWGKVADRVDIEPK